MKSTDNTILVTGGSSGIGDGQRFSQIGKRKIVTKPAVHQHVIPSEVEGSRALPYRSYNGFFDSAQNNGGVR